VNSIGVRFSPATYSLKSQHGLEDLILASHSLMYRDLLDLDHERYSFLGASEPDRKKELDI